MPPPAAVAPAAVVAFPAIIPITVPITVAPVVPVVTLPEGDHPITVGTAARVGNADGRGEAVASGGLLHDAHIPATVEQTHHHIPTIAWQPFVDARAVGHSRIDAARPHITPAHGDEHLAVHSPGPGEQLSIHRRRVRGGDLRRGGNEQCRGGQRTGRKQETGTACGGRGNGAGRTMHSHGVLVVTGARR